MTESNRLTDKQKQINFSTSKCWEKYASHRQRVTRLLVDKCPADEKSLCVLGAGNCNDIDLKRLREKFDRIDLIDLDLAAMERGVAAQGCGEDATLTLRGDCDVTGVWDELAALNNRTPETVVDVGQLTAAILAWRGLTLEQPYGVVASCGLLSQLVDGVIDALGESCAGYVDVITAIRQRHLRLLAELTCDGGSAALLTDFVSSDTAPFLRTMREDQLPSVLMQLIGQQNFLTGINPVRIFQSLHDDPVMMRFATDIVSEAPWLWHFEQRSYAVFALSFRKVSE